MVNINNLFRKTFSFSINSSSKTNNHVKKRFLKVALTSEYLAKSVLNCVKNSDAVEYHGNK